MPSPTTRLGYALSAALLSTLATAKPAHAALDELLSDEATDVTRVKIGTHELRVRERNGVKAFADETGRIFAARWRGVASLDALLGPHQAEYETALRNRRLRGHQLVRVTTPDLRISVLVCGRVSFGKIVLPSQLPPGVRLEALR